MIDGRIDKSQARNTVTSLISKRLNTKKVSRKLEPASVNSLNSPTLNVGNSVKHAIKAEVAVVDVTTPLPRGKNKNDSDICEQNITSFDENFYSAVSNRTNNRKTIKMCVQT